VGTLIDTLYLYAQENRVPGHLQTSEYRRTVTGTEEGWEAFRSALTAEQGVKLDALLSREIAVNCLEDKAAFLAGISIGLDLGRL